MPAGDGLAWAWNEVVVARLLYQNLPMGTGESRRNLSQSSRFPNRDVNRGPPSPKQEW